LIYDFVALFQAPSTILLTHYIVIKVSVWAVMDLFVVSEIWRITGVSRLILSYIEPRQRGYEIGY